MLNKSLTSGKKSELNQNVILNAYAFGDAPSCPLFISPNNHIVPYHRTTTRTFGSNVRDDGSSPQLLQEENFK